MKKRTLLFLLLIGIGLIVSFVIPSAPEPSEASLRHLPMGDVIGFEDKANTFAWLGIPFAKPPVGELRWRAPRSVDAWEGLFEALKTSPMCPQIVPFSLFKKVFTVGDEDCLYLNVWTPRFTSVETADSKLPVMVWIHGGANTMGGASPADPYRLAGQENMVVVSLQYRLGLLGWFSHPALRNAAATENDATANFALLDMVMALQWVQENIATFGGDPDNVTIFGQSAGAFNIIALMATPQAKGLFHKAIAQSGTLHTIPQARAEHYLDDDAPGLPYSSREYINSLLIADGRADDRQQAKALQEQTVDSQLVDYLREKTVQDLLENAHKRDTGTLSYFVPTNIRDGQVLPRAPLMDVFSDPEQYNSVPVILGNNRDEYKLFLWSSPRFTTKRFGLFPKIKDQAEYDRISGYFSNQWQAVGVDEPARVLHSSQPGKVFTYRFDWSDQPTLLGVDMAQLIGAGHGIEVTVLFGRDAVDTLPLFAMVSDQVSWDELSAAMGHYWATFARTGSPSNGGDSALPEWQPWQEHGVKKILLDSNLKNGIAMADKTIYIADLKQRLRDDPFIKSQRERCELYVQLFYYALSNNFWNDKEYELLGCGAYRPEDFKGII